MLLDGLELGGGRALQMLIANAEVDGGAVAQFCCRRPELSEQRLALSNLCSCKARNPVS